MTLEPEYLVDVWPGEADEVYAVRVDQATADEAIAAVAAQYAIDPATLRIVERRTVNLPPDEDHVGRRRRAWIVGPA